MERVSGLQNFRRRFGFIDKNIGNVILGFTLLSVAALLTLLPAKKLADFFVLHGFFRISVPLLFMMSSYDYFSYMGEHFRWKEHTFLFVRRLLLFYVTYTSLFFLLQLPFSHESFPNLWWVKYFLNYLIVSLAPCTWMILAFLLGVGCVIGLALLKFRSWMILTLSFTLYIVSICTEVYFNAFVSNYILIEIWSVYSRFFVTTRNALFLGFFWCTLGWLFTQRKVAYGRKHTLWVLLSITSCLMFFEHWFAYRMGWAIDYKSSFMMVPVCVILFKLALLHMSPSNTFFDLNSNFVKIVFVAFMLLPHIALVIKKFGVADFLLFSLTLFVCLVISMIIVKGHQRGCRICGLFVW